MFSGIPTAVMISAISLLGVPGLLFIVWYVDQKRLDKVNADNQANLSRILADNQANLNKVLASYKEDVALIRQMYVDNVDLLRWHEVLSKDLKDIILMNTSEWQKTRGEVEAAREDIKENKFCPQLRVEERRDKIVGTPI